MPPRSSPAEEMQRARQDARRRQILAAQVRLLYSNANIGVGVTLVAMGILTCLHWGLVPHVVMISWCLYMFLVSVGRFTLARRYWRSAPSILETSRWQAAFGIGAGLGGAGWGAAGILLYPENNLANQVFLVFILGGMILGAASVLAPRPDAFLAFILPTGLAPAVRLVVHGDEAHLAMGLLVGLFTLATLLTTRQIHLTIVSALNLQFENQDLVTDLQASLRERKRSEEALGLSEQRFRAIFSQAEVGISQTSPDKVWLAVNNRFCEMLGYTETELRGKTFLEVTHPEDVEESGRAVRRLLAGEIPSWHAEKRYIRKDGTIVWARVFVSLVRDERNVPQYFICAVDDITEKIQIESALRESERRLELAQEAARLGVWDTDLRTNTTTFSGVYASLYGLPDGHPPLSHTEWLTLVHPADRDRVESQRHESIEQERFIDTEFRVVWPDGSVHWLLGKGAVFLDDSGRPDRLVGVNLDITARKQADAALLESEQRFRRVFEEGPLGLGLVGKNYHFEKVNGALCQMVGYSEAELLQRSFVDITHPDDVQADVELAGLLFRGEIPSFKLRKRYVKKSGEVIWVDLTASVIRDKEGQPIYGLAMIEDITEAKRIQEEAIAGQKLESLGVLAGGIAHDFNNLLGGILSQTELASANLDEGTRPDEELKNIRAVAIRGAEIVRQLMTYAGQESATLELVDVSWLVEEMIELLEVVVSKHATLRLVLDKNAPAVFANRAMIHQILINLVTNASEAIGERDGVVEITTARGTGEADSSTAPGGVRGCDYLQLEVSDTGRGIEPELQARIFDPFFTTKSHGRGLGLAVVHGIVKRLGGTITVRNETRQGTTVRILLPSAGKSPTQRRDGVAAKTPRAACGTILLVEDEEPLRLAVSKMLRRAGFAVLEAASGSDALIMLQTHTNDVTVMLLDVTLPGIASTEVLREAKRLRPDLLVILTSAYNEESIAAKFAAFAPLPFLRKPYLLTELLTLLEPQVQT
jgi:two-component system cell cycle sensor histidine kinase/response regulator CckA